MSGTEPDPTAPDKLRNSNGGRPSRSLEDLLAEERHKARVHQTQADTLTDMVNRNRFGSMATRFDQQDAVIRKTEALLQVVVMTDADGVAEGVRLSDTAYDRIAVETVRRMTEQVQSPDGESAKAVLLSHLTDEELVIACEQRARKPLTGDDMRMLLYGIEDRIDNAEETVNGAEREARRVKERLQARKSEAEHRKTIVGDQSVQKPDKPARTITLADSYTSGQKEGVPQSSVRRQRSKDDLQRPSFNARRQSAPLEGLTPKLQSRRKKVTSGNSKSGQLNQDDTTMHPTTPSKGSGNPTDPSESNARRKSSSGSDAAMSPADHHMLDEEDDPIDDGVMTGLTGEIDVKFVKAERGDKMSYCYCQEFVVNGLMVRCDNKKCELRWFHWRCVGLSKAPGDWQCKECKKASNAGGADKPTLHTAEPDDDPGVRQTRSQKAGKDRVRQGIM